MDTLLKLGSKIKPSGDQLPTVRQLANIGAVKSAAYQAATRLIVKYAIEIYKAKA